MAVVDTFMYNGETQILKLHLAVLDPYVDKFVIVEANKTFSGKAKSLHFFRTQRYFEKYWPKIRYYIVSDWDDTNLWEQAILSPTTKGASHWKREFYIKESIHKALEYAEVEDDDTILLGDVDEIVDPTAFFESDTPVKAKLRVYSYYLNNRSNEKFWGTLIAKYKDIKGECLNIMRSDPNLFSGNEDLGWHFTSMGGLDEVRRKLDDSYTAESYNIPRVQEGLAAALENRTDFLFRPFQYHLDESEWPNHLKENREKYKHLLCK